MADLAKMVEEMPEGAACSDDEVWEQRDVLAALLRNAAEPHSRECVEHYTHNRICICRVEEALRKVGK